ncbi:MAG: TetR/AcrR family transcriptional regulator [Alphaproteobacteria bacterium]|nr:TetR/AcrR family transcriptional regulator [Alphaproteobacteria bacterium]MCW5743567.1 TetR/AcrR family transcriptional regulator [Alphaproteobacteria bacterium]
MPRTPPVKPAPAGKPRPRGRPRDEGARLAILRAAREMLEGGGVAAVTMEGVAQRAGVGKPTVYRHWPNAQAVAMAALLEDAPAEAGTRPSRGALPALRRQLRQIATMFATPMGRSVTMMLAAADQDTELSKAFRNHFILARRTDGKALLAAAIADGTLRTDFDIEVALDMIYGPLFYRLLAGHARLDAAFTEALLDHVLAGLAVRRPRVTKP